MKKSLLALAMLSSFSFNNVWADEWDMRLSASIYIGIDSSNELNGPNYSNGNNIIGNYQSIQNVACLRPKMDRIGNSQPKNYSISTLTDLFKAQTADIRTALKTEYRLMMTPNGPRRVNQPSQEFASDVEPLVDRLAIQASGVESAYDQVQREQREFAAAVDARKDGAHALDEVAREAKQTAENLASSAIQKKSDLANLLETLGRLLDKEYAADYSWTIDDQADDRLIVRFIQETKREISRIDQEVAEAHRYAAVKKQEADAYDRSPSRQQLEAAISRLKGAVVSTRDELRTLVQMVENRPKVREDMSLENSEDIRPDHRDDNKVKNDTKCLINVTEDLTQEVLRLR